MASRSLALIAGVVALVVVAVVAAVLLVGDDDGDDEETAQEPTAAEAGQEPTESELDPTEPVVADATQQELGISTATVPEAGTPAPAPSPPFEGAFGFGQEAGEDVVSAIDIDIPPSGAGLPDGSGTPGEGEEVYAAECAACHGETGREGGLGPVLVSEPGPWQEGMPRTIGSYWPYATTVYDYINRAMPFDEPGTLDPDEVYAVTAYLLWQNQIIGENDDMNAETLPTVEMPNQPNFFPCWPEECR